MNNCWCGCSKLLKWSGIYAYCPECCTLVDSTFQNAKTKEILDDGASLYDVTYWTEKMVGLYQASGCNTIDDIILLHYRERAAYWLHFFLRHAAPADKVLEIGCGMGTFCHWLSQLGFTVTATELSPAWRELINKKLGIAASDYSVSTAPERANSFDAIVLMDVLEHIQDPVNFLEAISNELCRTGILMVQLPQYDGSSTLNDLNRKKDGFLRYLIPGEHLFLYSQAGIKKLLNLFGFVHVQWYKSFFPNDMFFIASRAPLKYIELEAIDKTFMTPKTISAYAALKTFQHMQDTKKKRNINQYCTSLFNKILKK